MKPLRLLLALFLVAAPLAAQTPLSDRQVRQRLDFAIAQATNQRTAAQVTIDHLVITRAEVHRRIVADSLAALQTPPPPPDPTPPPPPPSTGALFESDWSTATGTSAAAVRDTNKSKPWTGMLGPLSVVAASSSSCTGWPTSNVLRVGNDWAELTYRAADNYYPAPAVGESIYFREYICFIGGSGNDDTHGVYFDDDPLAGVNWGPQALGFYVYPGSSVTFLVSSAAGTDPRYFSPGAGLQKGRVYRIETRYTRTGTNTYTIGARIYDAAGTLLYDESRFQDDFWYNGSPKLAGRTFTVNGAGANSMRGLKVGLESGQPGGSIFAEHAAIAVCRADWCGPYR